MRQIKTKNKIKGISIITLVITIVVIIILTAAITLSISQNNPIDKAKEAVLRNDIVSMIESHGLVYTFELSKYHGDKDKIEIEAFKDVIPEKYKMDFIAKIEYIEYNCKDKDVSKIAKELGVHLASENEIKGQVEISVSTEEAQASKVTVTLSYTNIPIGYEMEYKLGEESWQKYINPFEVTKNVIIEARLYNKDTNMQAAKNTKEITNISSKLYLLKGGKNLCESITGGYTQVYYNGTDKTPKFEYTNDYAYIECRPVDSSMRSIS